MTHLFPHNASIPTVSVINWCYESSLCLFFKQEINATPFEVFTSLNNLGIIMKNKSSVYMEDVNTSNIAWTDQFYIPISKTKLYKLI